MELNKALGVDLTVSVHGIPMAVPHAAAGHGACNGPSDQPARPGCSAQCRCRPAGRPCWSCGSGSPVTTRSASPCTCRTTSRRPSSRRRARWSGAVSGVTGLSLVDDRPRRRGGPEPAEIAREVEGSDEVKAGGGGAGAPVRHVHGGPRAAQPAGHRGLRAAARPTRSVPSSRRSSRTSPTTTRATRATRRQGQGREQRRPRLRLTLTWRRTSAG